MHAKLLKKCKAQKDDKLFFLAASRLFHLRSLGSYSKYHYFIAHQ